MAELTFLAAALAVSGAALIISSFVRLFRRRLMSAAACSCGGATLLTVGVVMISAAINITTYERLTHEHKALEIRFQALGERHYHASMRDPVSGTIQEFELRGDQWQLDARIIKWRAFINLIGFDTLYRFDRLSGRYQRIKDELSQPRTLYSLAQDPGLNIWEQMQEYPGLLPWVDAYYGNSAYLPMADGARFDVFVSQSGLLARPSNSAAKDAVFAWQ